MARDPARLRGRQAQAAHNDELILQAAREVFLADPEAPVSAVAARAGVGIGALYHRYASKEDLLRTLCRDGQLIYLAEAQRALEGGGDAWAAFTGFLRRIVAASTHGLTVRLAGTFEPTAEQMALAEQMRCSAPSCSSAPAPAGSSSRHHLARRGVPDGVAGPRPAGRRQPHGRAPAAPPRRHPRRAAQHRHTPLPGNPPTWPEQTERWVRR